MTSQVDEPVTTITTGNDVVTIINVFTVAPDRQAELLAVLTDATESVIRFLPGFVSANLHTSLDGRQVANYAQWRSAADLEAMLSDPDAAEHLQRCLEIATEIRPGLYRVAEVERRETET